MKHSKCCETLLPLYIGAMLHAKTRKKELVENFFELGLSVSYERVLHLSSDLGNAVSQQFKDNQVVCSPQLRVNLFTTAAVDNIDHNPSSSTSDSSFHGTAISVIQHPDFSGDRDKLSPLIINHRPESALKHFLPFIHASTQSQ